MGDGWTLLWFTASVFAASHVLAHFVRYKKLRFWVGYGSLFLGGAALITSFHSGLTDVNAVREELAKDRLGRAGREILDRVAWSEDYLCNFPAVKTSSSPSDFDEINAERVLACHVFQQIGSYATTQWDSASSPFAPTDDGLSEITDRIWRQSIERLEEASAEHAAALEALSQLHVQAWPLWSGLEPFLISASWSVGLALMVPVRRRKRTQVP